MREVFITLNGYVCIWNLSAASIVRICCKKKKEEEEK